MLGFKHFFLFTIKRGSLGTEEDLMKLSRKEFRRLWFTEEYFDPGLAIAFNTTKQKVKERRKELGINYIGGGLSFISGNK